MSKPTRATKFIHAAAKRVRDAKIAVTYHRAQGWVTISCKGQDDIFMQGDEADNFIAEIDAMTRRFPSLDDQTAADALAEPYTENIWS